MLSLAPRWEHLEKFHNQSQLRTSLAVPTPFPNLFGGISLHSISAVSSSVWKAEFAQLAEESHFGQVVVSSVLYQPSFF